VPGLDHRSKRVWPIFRPPVHGFGEPGAPDCPHGAIPRRTEFRREHEEARAVAALVSVRELCRGAPLVGPSQLLPRLRPLPLGGRDQAGSAHRTGLIARTVRAGAMARSDGPLGSAFSSMVRNRFCMESGCPAFEAYMALKSGQPANLARPTCRRCGFAEFGAHRTHKSAKPPLWTKSGNSLLECRPPKARS
jgi:hypothetical protein